MTFRATTIREWDGKLTIKIDGTVRYSPGKKEESAAFFIDPEYFSDRTDYPKWHFKTSGSSGSIEGRYAGHSFSGKREEVNFESKKIAETRKVFDVIIR